MKLLILLCFVAGAWSYEWTEIDEYVWRPDDTYRWELLQVDNWDNCTIYTLYLVSQTWYSEEWVDFPVWWHHFSIVVPENIDDIWHFDYAGLLIEGGSRTSSVPGRDNDFLRMCCQMTKDTHTPVSMLRQIPNQPMRFWADPSGRGRTEDALIAWTWEQYRLNKTGGDFLARAPMTKATIRAMDAMTEFTPSLDPRFNITKYMLTGGSKRGWTTWIAAAVDPVRVVAQAPLVMPALNFIENMHHYYEALGGWSWVLNDYYEMNLTLHIDDPNSQRIFDQVDPYVYRERYKGMPTYNVMACGDEFFQPDDTHFYWDDMEQPIYLNLVPNAEHSMMTRIPYVYRSLRSFFYSVVTGYKMPVMTWTREYTETGGRLTVTTDTEPTWMRSYWAKTLKTHRRDFRLVAPWENDTSIILPQPVLWWPENVTTIGDNVYVAEYDTPAEGDGWLGFQVSAKFPGPMPSTDEMDWDIVLTTEGVFLPKELPFPRCNGEECYGTLV